MRLTRWLKTLGMAMLPLGAAHAAVYTCDSVACLGVAILAANSTVEPDSIELAPRRYVLASPATDDLPFGPTGFPVVTSTITIRGNNAILQRAFYGCSVSQPTQNPFRLFGISSRGRLILQDLTLTAGCALGFPGDERGIGGAGGAIINDGGFLSLTRVTLSGNKARAGGALFSTRGTVLSTATSIVNNEAEHSGGGVALEEASAVFNAAIVQSNLSSSGGGLSILRGETQFNGRVLANGSTHSGGGFMVRDGILRIRDSEVGANRTTGPSGAGVAMVAGTLQVTRTTISANFCPRCQGGGVAVRDLDTGLQSFIRQSTIYGNSAAREGGGISARQGLAEFGTAPLLRVENSTLGMNFADTGAAVHAEAVAGSTVATVALVNVTLARNFAYRRGDALAVAGDGTILVLNTIVSSESSSAAENCFPVAAAGFISTGHNLGEDTTCNLVSIGDLSGVAAGLFPYAETGAPGGGHFPLGAGSLAIDAGICGLGLELDQLGRPRDDGRCDMGAVESRK
ncbi:MAG TPA: choice-of-anchor Q domain-containing protein [Steroidobacteraceae bacterium]|nr:choice-of-anchor Q domain-containing protein [Steroidobacteraceae bacterium]